MFAKVLLAAALIFGTTAAVESQVQNDPLPHCFPCPDDAR